MHHTFLLDPLNLAGQLTDEEKMIHVRTYELLLVDIFSSKFSLSYCLVPFFAPL